MSSIEIDVNVGNDETKIIVTGPAGVIHSQVLPITAAKMDEAISQYLGRKYKLRIGMKTAETLKGELGTTSSSEVWRTVEVRGRRFVGGALETISVSDKDIREALADLVSTIINAVTRAVKSIPAEEAATLAARGIVLKGGKGLPENIEQELMSATGIAVRRS